MNTSFDEVPDGFVPAGDTPLEDFFAKFVAVRYVADPGANQQRTYVFNDLDQLVVVQDDGLPLINTVAMAALHPLPPGQHVVQTFWTLSAMHCDGFAAVVAEDCLPAGESLQSQVTFTVSPP